MKRKEMPEQNERNIKKIIYISVSIIPIAALTLFALWVCRRYKAIPQPEPVVIAVPYSEWVQDYETNYYTSWLEEQTGYDITFVYLEEGYERESLDMMLTSEYSNVDAIFFPSAQEIISCEEYRDYIREGYLSPPQDYLAPDSNFSKLRENYPEADFSNLLDSDGRLYCFPSLNMARTNRNMQVLWVNIEWLTRLKLTIPRTTEEFREMLIAFWKDDPNGNGRQDELPMISCDAENAFQSCRFLLNAFAYYDGTCLPGYGYDNASELEAFREGIVFCAELYEQGLLTGDTFSYTNKQMMELVNDPADTVGAFASHSIADVIYTNNPGVLAHYVQLAPLSSDVLERGYAVRTDILPEIGGLIPANAAHKEAAARIMDLMLSDEAALIALYGEEGADWRFSRDGELSTYGTRAVVTTIRYLKGERQNQNYSGTGPLVVAAQYIDGVTWNGDHSMTEYIDARAVKAYEAYYYPGFSEGAGLPASEKNGAENEVSAYLEEGIRRFITGEKDVENDADWEDFLDGYERLIR